jgi:Flp pilus assembly protein TadD
MTLGALGLRGLTGQLTLAGQYRVAFQQGAVVGAYSPLANDAAVRVALTGNLITSSQVNDIIRRIAAARERDEVDVLAEACRLQPDQAQRLRRRLVAQRAARTFAVDQGEFVVEDEITISVVPGSELDVRAIVFLGARNNLTEPRLASELAQLGVWFKLEPGAIDDLGQYGFTEEEKPVLQLLLHGANLGDVEAINAGLGARTVRAVAYSLAVCGACETSMTAGPSLPRVPASAMQPGSTPRAGSPTVPPPTVMRAATPAQTAPPEPKQHKTAPLGSRSPAAGSQPPAMQGAPINESGTDEPVTGRVPTRGSAPIGDRPRRPSDVANSVYSVPSPNRSSSNPPSSGPAQSQPPNHAPYSVPTTFGVDPATGRVPEPEPVRARAPTPGLPLGRSNTPTPSDPTISRSRTPHDSTGPSGPRTITQSSGVPREADSRNSSGATASRSSGSFSAATGHDRSPSGGTRTRDQSPASGTRAQRPTGRAASQSSSPAVPRTSTNNLDASLRSPADGGTRSRAGSSQSMRAFSTQSPPLRAPAGPARPTKPGSRRPKQSTAATIEIDALLQKKIPMLDQGVDYFTLFGLPMDASADDVRSTYFMLARKLHPDRLAAIGVEDEDRQAQRLMACINEAFSVLNDPVRRAEYLSILNRGGEAAVRAEEQKADEIAMKVMRAEEEFRQGEMALRREQIAAAIAHFKLAVELQPNEPEYQALLAWAQFANAQDKSTVASQTRKALIRAAESNSESPTAHFYLGRVERMLGREKEALYCFYQVLRIKPNHSEAKSEARILEQRLKARK